LAVATRSVPRRCRRMRQRSGMTPEPHTLW
jgi:hypothetical protein